ncbi:MAG: hypothetical protein R3Y68_09095 [Rikenellaceae bacterium]
MKRSISMLLLPLISEVSVAVAQDYVAVDLAAQVQWLNAESVELAIDDMVTNLGADRASFDDDFNALKPLLEQGFGGLKRARRSLRSVLCVLWRSTARLWWLGESNLPTNMVMVRV